MRNFAALWVVIISAAFTTAQADDACGIDRLLEAGGMRILKEEKRVTESTGTEITLAYSGFFKKTNARLEGRRLVSKLKQCYQTQHRDVETLFGYQITIRLEPAGTEP